MLTEELSGVTEQDAAELARYIIDHKTDRTGLFCDQGSRHFIRPVIQLFDRGFDLFTVFTAYIPAVQIFRDRCQCQTGLCFNVFDRRCHRFPPVSSDLPGA